MSVKDMMHRIADLEADNARLRDDVDALPDPATFAHTLRELAAMAAMQGMMARNEDGPMRGYEGWREEFCSEAVRYADAMIAALARTEGA